MERIVGTRKSLNCLEAVELSAQLESERNDGARP